MKIYFIFFYYITIFSVSNVRKKLVNLGEDDGALERKGIYQILRVVVIAEIRLLKLFLFLIQLNIGMSSHYSFHTNQLQYPFTFTKMTELLQSKLNSSNV